MLRVGELRGPLGINIYILRLLELVIAFQVLARGSSVHTGPLRLRLNDDLLLLKARSLRAVTQLRLVVGGALVGPVQVLLGTGVRGRLETGVLPDLSGGSVPLGGVVRESSYLDLWLEVLLRLPERLCRALTRGKILGELARLGHVCLVAVLAHVVLDGGLCLWTTQAPLAACTAVLRIWDH